MPSTRILKGDLKKKAIDIYKSNLKQIKCKHYSATQKCPFSFSCFYKHVNPDGSEEEIPEGGRPKYRTLYNSYSRRERRSNNLSFREFLHMFSLIDSDDDLDLGYLGYEESGDVEAYSSYEDGVEQEEDEDDDEEESRDIYEDMHEQEEDGDDGEEDHDGVEDGDEVDDIRDEGDGEDDHDEDIDDGRVIDGDDIYLYEEDDEDEIIEEYTDYPLMEDFNFYGESSYGDYYIDEIYHDDASSDGY